MYLFVLTFDFLSIAVCNIDCFLNSFRLSNVHIVPLEMVNKSNSGVTIFFFFVFCPRPTPMAYGGSQARDPVGAVATGQCHSQCQIPAASATYTTAHSNAGSLTH